MAFVEESAVGACGPSTSALECGPEYTWRAGSWSRVDAVTLMRLDVQQYRTSGACVECINGAVATRRQSNSGAISVGFWGLRVARDQAEENKNC